MAVMKVIHHVVDIDAPADAIWAALTEQDRMAQWWSTKVDAPDAAVGTRVRWAFAGDFNPVMEITAADPPASLSWRCVGGHPPWQDSTLGFEVAPLDDGRHRLRFWQRCDVELADDDYGTYNFNWGYYLESLRLLCTEGSGRPFLSI
jgi:uncharacterized protein YndB with AHSA1/START domain